MEAVRGFPTHLEASLAAGIISVRHPLLYRFPFKLGEHDTDIQHRPPHRGGGVKLLALQVELLHVDSEIEKLVDSLTGANNVLLSYVNVKIAELDGRKQELLARIAELTVEAISPEQVSQISGYLDTWDNVSFDDKRRVVDLMITTVAATSDSLNITWKI